MSGPPDYETCSECGCPYEPDEIAQKTISKFGEAMCNDCGEEYFAMMEETHGGECCDDCGEDC